MISKVFAGTKLINDIEYRVVLSVTGIKHLRELLKLTHREVKDYWKITKIPEEIKLVSEKPWSIYGCPTFIDQPKISDYKELNIDEITETSNSN